MHDVEQLVKTTLSELKQLANTQSVVGEPVQVGHATIIPLVKLGFGFGAASRADGKADDQSTGGGTGAGAGVSPVALLIVTKEEVRLESIGGNTVGSSTSTADKVLDLIKMAMEKHKKKTADESDETDDE